MAKRKRIPLKDWFSNCGGWKPRHDLDELQRGLDSGLLDAQDEYGLTALSFAALSKWLAGVELLLRAGADPELRYCRDGATTLLMAAQNADETIVAALVAGGANPDAANHFGLTPRTWLAHRGWAHLIESIPPGEIQYPAPLIQNAEHLADHYHPRFQIPDRDERETLKVGQAVDLYVYGPRSDDKQDTVKVRITKKQGRRPKVIYTARVETPLARTHLADGTTEVTFGPEHVASVYVPGPYNK